MAEEWACVHQRSSLTTRNRSAEGREALGPSVSCLKGLGSPRLPQALTGFPGSSLWGRGCPREPNAAGPCSACTPLQSACSPPATHSSSPAWHHPTGKLSNEGRPGVRRAPGAGELRRCQRRQAPYRSGLLRVSCGPWVGCSRRVGRPPPRVTVQRLQRLAGPPAAPSSSSTSC